MPELQLRNLLPQSLKNNTRSLRRRVLLARVAWRAALGRERMSPSFIIVGAMKAGTTSLFRYLSEHPRILPPIAKEIHYLNFNWSRGERWYRAHFPVIARPPNEHISGEASPGYLLHPRAPARARAIVPDVKIIVLLRDPVARTLSHYFHQLHGGRETRPIDEAMHSPEAFARFRLGPDEERAWYDALNGGSRMRRRGADLLARHPMHHSYISTSFYADYLCNWLSEFERDRILVLKSEELFEDPKRQIANTLAFLGLDVVLPSNVTAHNTGAYPETVPGDIISSLREVFAEPNRRLYELLKRDFGWRTE